MPATFAEAYQLEISAEEDVYRTLSFFGTALGIVIAAIGYAEGRLTPWGELPVDWLFLGSSGLLALAALESIGVIFRLSRALARRDYQRIGPVRVLRERLEEQRAYELAGIRPTPSRRNRSSPDRLGLFRSTGRRLSAAGSTFLGASAARVSRWSVMGLSSARVRFRPTRI